MEGEPDTVAGVLRRQADSRGPHPLLACDGALLSYAEAERRSAQLARSLVARGVGKGTHIGLLYPNGTDFVVVPYTLRNNDILLIEGRNYSPEQFLAQIKLDFDQLYDEAGSRRRMMSVSAHDRISGTPQMVKVWDAFLTYARKRSGVAFLRKDAIARYVLQSPLTLRESETI